jgi:L-threonylcarbamoyladenylate synthase
VKGYKDASEIGAAAPRAPGMKYKHYSPKAKVVLYEAASKRDTRTGRDSNSGIPLEVWHLLAAKDGKLSYLGLEAADWPIKVGIVSTKHWRNWAGFHEAKWSRDEDPNLETIMDSAALSDGEWDSVIVNHGKEDDPEYEPESFDSTWTRSTRNHIMHVYSSPVPEPSTLEFEVKTGMLWQGNRRESGSSSSEESFEDDFLKESRHIADIYEIALGSETKDIAHGLFSALRELDQREADVIYVEGIEDEGDIAAAVMNRLRKAASVIEK